MDREDLMLGGVLVGALFAIAAFFAMLTHLTLETDRRIAELVAGGANPIAARCALRGGPECLCARADGNSPRQD